MRRDSYAAPRWRWPLVFLVLSTLACTSPPEFPEWTISVPEGTPVIEYAHVPSSERTEWIGLERDLTIGGGDEADRGFIYQPQAIAVDEAGRVYVADIGDHVVKVFEEAGNHAISLGRQGQGPAEFMGPIGVGVAGPTVVVVDANKLSFWTLAGEHREDVSVQQLTPQKILGLADGTVLVAYPAIDEAARRQLMRFERWDATAEPTATFPTLPAPPTMFYPSADAEGSRAYSAGASWPSIAADPGGDVYLTRADEYQVVAFAADGSARWAMRVAMARPPMFRRDIERTLESIRRRFPDATESSVDWPPAAHALDTIWVDDHGHLYIFPYAPRELEARERDVDVYSSDGERLFAGRMVLPAGAWTQQFAAHENHLFFLDQAAESGEWQVVRYRLTEPFALR